ncbi:MAG: 5-(carboxyamino)imidazole ribonucleotide mutase [Nannocystaceae bacterium]
MSDSKIPLLVGICMGSTSDLPVMGAAAEILQSFEIPHEVRIISAHRTPMAMVEYGRTAVARGLRVIIAGAGGAAHLPGMLAALTPLPVIGVPVPLARLDGLDSLMSIVQMPKGTPVATVAIGQAANAGHLAARILGISHPAVRAAVERYQAQQEQAVAGHDADVAARMSSATAAVEPDL